MRRILLLCGVAAALSAAAPAAMAAPGGSMCQLKGTADFSVGLTTTAQPFTYSFAGDLTGCQSTATAPATGKVSAGKTITVGGVTYQQPIATGNGSCASSTTAGVAFVEWADGTLTIVKYATNGVAALVALTGSVQPSIELPIVDAAAGGPTTGTLTTTRWAGASAGGPIEFKPADPSACAGAGVKTAAIEGFLGLGSSS